MPEDFIIEFGGLERERVEISVSGYESSERTGDWHDDNWIVVQIHAIVGGFTARADATFITLELEDLSRDLKILHETLTGEVAFSTMEGQLSLRFVGNGRGQIILSGEILDQPGRGNRLIFSLELDQTHLIKALSQLNRVMATFPVR